MKLHSGFGASQGVFREHYFKSGPFKGNQLVASIGLLVVVSSDGRRRSHQWTDS